MYLLADLGGGGQMVLIYRFCEIRLRHKTILVVAVVAHRYAGTHNWH